MTNNIFKFSLVLFLFAAIGCSNNAETTFDINEMRGTYELDMKEAMEKAMAQAEQEGLENPMGGMAQMMMSAMTFELEFTENNKGMASVDAGMLGMLGGNEAAEALNQKFPFEYKVDENNVVSISDGTRGFEKFGTISKVTGDHDKIIIVVEAPDLDEPFNVTLEKQ